MIKGDKVLHQFLKKMVKRRMTDSELFQLQDFHHRTSFNIDPE